MKIPFNRPLFFPDSISQLSKIENAPKLSSGGLISNDCENALLGQTGSKNLLVPSATAALEMMALLLEIKPGDEVIVPSFTFVTSASAFSLRGALIRFADIDNFGNISLESVERLINSKTKAVCAVHYASHSCDLDQLQNLCSERGVSLLEDAAQCIDSWYKGRHLGTFGQLGCFSFHDTKNVSAGEGGSLIVNDNFLLERSEIIRDKGTNRKAFLKGEVDKYTWIELGSSYCFSELNAAWLLPQLERINIITEKRKHLWNTYYSEVSSALNEIGASILTPPEYNQSNYHMFAVLMPDGSQRDKLHEILNTQGIQATFHYQPLHLSPFGKSYGTVKLPNTERFASQILRLPLYFNFNEVEQDFVISNLKKNLKLLN